jgi:hypothetical protein
MKDIQKRIEETVFRWFNDNDLVMHVDKVSPLNDKILELIKDYGESLIGETEDFVKGKHLENKSWEIVYIKDVLIFLKEQRAKLNGDIK